MAFTIRALRGPLRHALRALSTAAHAQTSTLEAAKRLAAQQAVEAHFQPSMRFVGVGSGSTIVHVVSALRSLPPEAISNTTFVPTGFQSRQLLLSAGMRVSAIDEVPPCQLEVAFDGADEVDPSRNCIKGGGACLLLEKLVAVNAKTFVVVADWTKISKALCTKYARGIPIEILPASLPYVMERLKTLGAVPTLRMGGAAKAGPCVTDNGNFIIDAALPKGYRGRGEDEMKGLDNSAHVIQLARLLSGIVGVVEHGLFSQVDKKPNVVYFGMEDGTVQILGKKALNKL